MKIWHIQYFWTLMICVFAIYSRKLRATKFTCVFFLNIMKISIMSCASAFIVFEYSHTILTLKMTYYIILFHRANYISLWIKLKGLCFLCNFHNIKKLWKSWSFFWRLCEAQIYPSIVHSSKQKFSNIPGSCSSLMSSKYGRFLSTR